jgi:hypothetical protein
MTRYFPHITSQRGRRMGEGKKKGKSKKMERKR